MSEKVVHLPAHIFRNRRFHTEFFTGKWLQKREGSGVERCSSHLRYSAVSVQRVAQEGIADGCHMHPDLEGLPVFSRISIINGTSINGTRNF